MTAVVKAAGGGVIVVGSGGAIGYGVKYVLEMEPNFVPLSSSTSLDTYETGKLGAIEANKSLFADPDQNEEWWNWAYKNLLSVDKTERPNDVYSVFNSVTKGYSNSENTALNQVCKSAFKKEPKEVTNIKYKKNIWKYCSKDRDDLTKHEKAPNFIDLNDTKAASSQVTGNNKLGAVTDNKPKLVADISDNEEAWNWIYENRFLVRKAKSENDIHYDLKTITKGYSSSETDSLNKVCKTAYDKTKSDLSGSEDKSKYKKNIELYCTKEGKEDTLTLPTD